jgi:putative addiction module component (TIGR02574 family)
MSTLMSTLGIERLSTDDRLQLVREILDSLAAESEAPPLTDVQRQELGRRISALNANPEALTPWAEVEARVLARLRE